MAAVSVRDVTRRLRGRAGVRRPVASRSSRASSSSCSGRPAAASRPCSMPSPACSTSPTARSGSASSNVTWEEPKDRGIAMVFQSYALYPRMTVRENMSFGLQDGQDAQARDREARRQGGRAPADRAICSTAGPTSSPAASASASRSAGRWCAMPRCSCSTSRSPTSTPSSATSCASRSSGCTRRLGTTTMIYVTHDQIEAMTLADRIVGDEGAEDPADRHARRDLSPPGQPVRRRLRRLAADELHQGQDRGRRRRAGFRRRRAPPPPVAATRSHARPSPGRRWCSASGPEHLEIGERRHLARLHGRHRRAHGRRHGDLVQRRRGSPFRCAPAAASKAAAGRASGARRRRRRRSRSSPRIPAIASELPTWRPSRAFARAPAFSNHEDSHERHGQSLDSALHLALPGGPRPHARYVGGGRLPQRRDGRLASRQCRRASGPSSMRAASRRPPAMSAWRLCARSPRPSWTPAGPSASRISSCPRFRPEQRDMAADGWRSLGRELGRMARALSGCRASASATTTITGS